MHRDSILKGEQCLIRLHGQTYTVSSFDYVNRIYLSIFKPAVIVSELLPYIWEKRRACKKVIDFRQIFYIGRKRLIATKNNRIFGFFD